MRVLYLSFACCALFLFAGCNDESASQQGGAEKAGQDEPAKAGSLSQSLGGAQEAVFTGTIGDEDAATPMAGQAFNPDAGEVSVSRAGNVGNVGGENAVGGTVGGDPSGGGMEVGPGGMSGGDVAGRIGGSVAGRAVGGENAPMGGLALVGGQGANAGQAGGGGQGANAGQAGGGGHADLGCVIGESVGLCEICGPGNVTFSPQSDPQCMNLQNCPRLGYRLEERGDERLCFERRNEHDGSCSQIGQCADAVEACRSRDVLLAVDNPCSRVNRCNGDEAPDIQLSELASPCGDGQDLCGRIDDVLRCTDWRTATRQKVREEGLLPCSWSATQERRFQHVFAPDDGVEKTCTDVCVSLGWTCYQVGVQDSAPCRADGSSDVVGEPVGCNTAGINMYCKCRVD